MAARPASLTLSVDGMTCASCERRIEAAVAALPGVTKVQASAPLSEVRVRVTAGGASRADVTAAIAGAGYSVQETAPVTPSRATAWYRFLGLLAVVAAVFVGLKALGGFTWLPTVTSTMGYGMLFVVGLLTSLHCVAMCGGIALSQGLAKQGGEPAARVRPTVLYNAGRVVSYTVIGGIAGAVGSAFALSSALKGIMPVIAGAFMLFLGVRMLGIFPWLSRLPVRLPRIGGRGLRQAASRRGPFVVGLLNGLMPCGPLQTMQVYALGTGSVLAGASSMLLFSLGTVPLMLGFGALSAFLSAKFTRRMAAASAVLVMALGALMVGRGLNLFGVGIPSLPAARAAAAAGGDGSVAVVAGGVQTVRSTVESGTYHPIVVQSGIPVRWTVTVKEDDLNGCNSPLTVPAFGVRRELLPGENVIEFTPTTPGTITYTCWMGMISSTITVVADLASGGTAAPAPTVASAFGGSAAAAGNGQVPARFAAGKVPTDQVATATLADGVQVVDVTVDADGYTPAVLVLRRGVPARIRFVAAGLDSCNSVVDFPEYGGRLDLAGGQRQTPLLEVSSDFTFQCGMGMLHGYVKVVDDTAAVDFAALRREVAAYTPAAAATCCCGR